jgi:hypothetical protein
MITHPRMINTDPPAPSAGQARPMPSALNGNARPSSLVGVIMLDTHFPRPPGDMGQPQTYQRAGIAARLLRVPQASAMRVVKQADPALLQPFIDAAVTLVNEGATLITTTCGFLARHQRALQAAVSVPVLTSSLLQCKQLPDCGIVTFDAASLSADVLEGAQVPLATPVAGLEPGCTMHRAILEDHPEMDLAQARSDVVRAAMQLVEQHPRLSHIVLECANMPPYRQSVAQATGRTVHDLETLLLDRAGKGCI